MYILIYFLGGNDVSKIEETLWTNYDEINNLTKIYSDISPRLLKQAINRKQKTVMNKKYSLTVLRAHNK